MTAPYSARIRGTAAHRRRTIARTLFYSPMVAAGVVAFIHAAHTAA